MRPRDWIGAIDRVLEVKETPPRSRPDANPAPYTGMARASSATVIRTAVVGAVGCVLFGWPAAAAATVWSPSPQPALIAPSEADPPEKSLALAPAGEPLPADTAVRTVIVNTKSDGLTASGRTIGPRTISTMPKRSAEDLLRLVPGIVIVQHGSQGKGYQFYLRGFDAGHRSDIETRLEGIPLNEASNVHAHGYLDLAFIIPEAVIAVDARKGAFRLDQGNFATAGTIDYRLGVAAAERGTRTLYEIGTTNRHRLVAVHAPKTRSERTFVAVEALHDSGYGQNRWARRISGLSQVDLWSNGDNNVAMVASVYAARFGLPGTLRLDDYKSGRVGFNAAYTNATSGTSARAILGVRAQARRGRTRLELATFGSLRSLTLDENFTGHLQFPERGDRHKQRHDSGMLGATATVGVAVHERVELRAIAQWQGHLSEQRQEQLLESGKPWAVSRDLDIRTNHFTFGPGLRAFPAAWLAIDGGLRVDLVRNWVRDALQGGQRFTGHAYAVSPRAPRQGRGGRFSQPTAEDFARLRRVRSPCPPHRQRMSISTGSRVASHA